MSDEEWAHGGPQGPDGRLLAAFGTEVEALTIGPSPIGAVLRDGVALRKRRRMVWSGGVAGLLVLPVAAVVAFGGGTGTSHDDALGTARPTPTPMSTTAAAVTATISATGNPAPSLSRPGHQQQPPNPVDTIDVIGSGTFEGRPWRLVRDRFAVAAGTMGFGSPHKPFTSAGKNGLEGCEFLGIQWGDAPAGSEPDFHGAGGCATAPGTTPGGLNDPYTASLFPQGGPPGEGIMVDGPVDTTKVATFDILLDGARKVDPTPVFQLTGEPVGYYAGVVPMPGVRSVDQHTIVVEFRDAHGKVVGQYSNQLSLMR